MAVTPTPDWSRIDVVCLDMDGTVLDLHFDNLFWLELLPRRWGEARGLDYAAAMAQLRPRFEAKRGTLEWYCVDHWSEELGLDVPALKYELRAEIRYLDGAAGIPRLAAGHGQARAAHHQRASAQPAGQGCADAAVAAFRRAGDVA